MVLDEFNILITAVGGQGGLTLSRIIASAALKEGYNVRIGETLGMSQRGGAVMSFVRFGGKVYSPLFSEGEADILIGLEPVETLRRIEYASEKTFLLMNTQPIKPVPTNLGIETYPEIDRIIEYIDRFVRKKIITNFFERTIKIGSPRVMNVLMLGTIVGAEKLPIKEDNIKKAIEEIVPKKALDINLKAFTEGKRIGSSENIIGNA
ncbi:MAG: indolepyruvate oxidoreductase subunit beta [Candidatus Korarchaeota archaeon]|nr:indolepyruvate oxidoreductase subunit beta [Candidatus Korarchaeota archaeon]